MNILKQTHHQLLLCVCVCACVCVEGGITNGGFDPALPTLLLFLLPTGTAPLMSGYIKKTTSYCTAVVKRLFCSVDIMEDNRS